MTMAMQKKFLKITKKPRILEKKILKLDFFFKFKAFVFSRTPFRKLKSRPQTGRKYLTYTKNTMCVHTQHIYV